VGGPVRSQPAFYRAKAGGGGAGPLPRAAPERAARRPARTTAGMGKTLAAVCCARAVRRDRKHKRATSAIGRPN